MASISRFDLDKMADENVPDPAPTRSNDQILPFATRTYSFELDETRFVLDANLLREALEITSIDQAHRFVSPPLGDAIMDFVNELGYTEANLGNPTKKGRKDKAHVIPYCWFMKLIIYHLGRAHNIHQRSASLFHLAEEDLRLGNLKFVPKGKDDEVFGMPIPNELISNNIRNAPYYNAYLEMVAKHDRKIIAEKAKKKKPTTAKQPKSKSATEKSSKPAPASKPKPAKEKLSKTSTGKPPKPKPIKEKSTKATPLQKANKGKVAKVCNVKCSFQLVDEPDEELAQPKPEPEPEPKLQGEGEEYDVERAIQMSLESFHAAGHVHVGGVAIQEPVAKATQPLPVVEGNSKAIVTEEQATQSLLALHTPKRRSTTDQFIFQRWTPATKEASTRPSAQPHHDTSANVIRKSSSPIDAKTCAESDKINNGGDTEILQITEELEEDTDKRVNLEEKTAELDQDQAGSDPGETHESRTSPKQAFMDEDQARPNPGESGVALTRSDPEPTHDEFMANLYPRVQESLNFLADEHVILEDPLSSTGTLSLIKNMDDAYTIGDQFINDKSTEDESEKLNVEAKVVSMVTVLIYQASSLVPPLSTPVVDLSLPKPASSTTQAPIFTATTTTITTTLPPPPQL
ncbi:hypothetical protein Tco_0925565 [Tanacetum coccineum]|uniref:Histone deacetylase 14 n=1 Tax=Tanacetum coccineum TaxID=301880 RepID=A0ABQ5DA63_9ASTR